MSEFIKTHEIAEAAIFYMNNLDMKAYEEKQWVFVGDRDSASQLKLELINKKLKVEPLEFMEAIRRVKSFSNGINK